MRGGYAELGSSFHHARIYKIVGGKKPVFSMMRVYTVDLLKYENEDLFAVELKPQTMTIRQCEPKLRKALAAGQAEYLGWLVVDDELFLDTTEISTNQLTSVQSVFGKISRWRVDGFYDVSRLRLRPIQMSAEGISDEMPAELKKILDTPGWRPSVNKLFDLGKVTVIRRDALGRVRLSSSAHLPITWAAG